MGPWPFLFWAIGHNLLNPSTCCPLELAYFCVAIPSHLAKTDYTSNYLFVCKCAGKQENVYIIYSLSYNCAVKQKTV